MNSAEHWWLGISPEGIGTVGMMINFLVTVVVSWLTPSPPAHIQQLVENIRVPQGVGEAHKISG